MVVPWFPTSSLLASPIDSDSRSRSRNALFEAILPFCTSLALHLAIVIAGVLTYRAVRVAARPNSIDQVVIPDLVDAPVAEGGVLHPGFLDRSRDAAQLEFESVKDPGGISPTAGRSLAATIAGGGAEADPDTPDTLGVGPAPVIRRGTGGGAGDGGGDAGAIAVFGMPGGGGGGPIRGIFGPGIARSNARKIVFVLDATGSMIGSFDALRVQLRLSLQNLRPSYSFNILFINDRDVPPLAPTLVYATPENKRKAVEYADTMAPRGSTNPLPALRKALELKPELIYFLIDPSDFPDRQAVLDLVRARAGDGRIKLNIIAFEGNDPENNRFLQELATITGGVYRFVTEKELRETR